MPEKILLIGTDAAVKGQVRNACEELGVEMACADTFEEVEKTAPSWIPDLVLCDFATFEKVRARWRGVCAVLVAEGTDSEQAIESIKQGALDYLLKPLDAEVLLRRIREALRISRDIHVPAVYEAPQEDVGVERIVGQSPAMQEVYKLIGLLAPREINVLITGESGTGKELVARAIYHHSARRGKPFLAVNCAAIPETLLESELFGHEKGAFTGADLRRIGKFEQCDGGTLFLDEVGDIPLTTQAKLLRVLQDGTFQRLGGTATVRCDVRILAATNQDLERLIEQRRFRQDLFYRLKVASIEVPPLREREVDVVLLAHYFVKRLNPQIGTQIRNFAPEVLPALLAYPWPGNVRELENAIKASLAVARGTTFRLEFLPEHIRGYVPPAGGRPAPAAKRRGAHTLEADLRRVAEALVADAGPEGRLYETAITAFEREMIRAALERTRGRLAPAARFLGISRTTLRKKMHQYGIEIDTSIRLNE